MKLGSKKAGVFFFFFFWGGGGVAVFVWFLFVFMLLEMFCVFWLFSGIFVGLRSCI